MFPHKINENFLYIREARQAQRLLSPRRETKFSLPEAKGAAFPWLHAAAAGASPWSE